MNSFTLTKEFQVPPMTIYTAWLDGDQHAAMTGGAATGEEKVGSEFTAWDDYIFGKNLELIPGEKIVQSWRTTEFKEEDEDSELIIDLHPTHEGCEIILHHKNIPDGQSNYKQGWIEHYFEPMEKYFK